MSNFSGVCDLFDNIIDINGTTDFSKVHIYIGEHPIELRIDSQKDLIPYYPFVAGLSNYYNGEQWYSIGNEPSYVHEERRMLETDMRYIQRTYRRFKCQKKEITVESLAEKCMSSLWNWRRNEDTLKKLIKRVIDAKGKDVNFKDLQLDYSQCFRKKLYNEMINNGYPHLVALKWCYGFEKTIELGMNDKIL